MIEIFLPSETITATCPVCSSGQARLVKTVATIQGEMVRLEHHVDCQKCRRLRFQVIDNFPLKQFQELKRLYRQEKDDAITEAEQLSLLREMWGTQKGL